MRAVRGSVRLQWRSEGDTTCPLYLCSSLRYRRPLPPSVPYLPGETIVSPEKFAWLSSISPGTDGAIYLLERNDAQILRIDRDGTDQVLLPSDPSRSGAALLALADGRLLLGNAAEDQVLALDEATGAVLGVWYDGRPALLGARMMLGPCP